MRVLTVVGEHRAMFTVLFITCMAAAAGAARIHQATDSDQLALLEFLHLSASLDHASDYFVAGYTRINGVLPLVACLMDVRMAHTAKKDINKHIVGAKFAPSNGKGRQRGGGVLRSIGFCS